MTTDTTALTPKALSPTALSEAELAKEINEALSFMASSFQNSVKHAIKAGLLLSEAKDRVGHGAFEGWLEQHCKLSFRTARRYMKLAEHRKEIEAKSATVTELKLADAYKLIGVTKSDEKSNDSANSNDSARSALSAVKTLEDNLLTALKTLRKKDEGKAKEAASKVVQRLADADLIAQL